jgi:flagellar L-ring protein precursor FlgH
MCFLRVTNIIRVKKMSAVMRRFFILTLGASLGACAVTPSTVTNMAPVNRPQPTAHQASNGSIYHNSAFRPIFEDLRARHVGDVLTIVMNENTAAGRSDVSSLQKDGKLNDSVSASLSGFGVPVPGYSGKGSAQVQTSNGVKDTGIVNNSNNFTGNVTVQITDIDENGNYVVSGEKQLAFDKGVEYVRFSGLVFPYMVAADNTVASTQVANARVEYRSSDQLDTATVMRAFSRFFQNVIMPF